MYIRLRLSHFEVIANDEVEQGFCMFTRLLCVYVSTVRPPVTSCILYRACRAS